MHAPELMCTCISECTYTCQVSGKLISYDKAQEIQHQRHYNIFLNMIHKGLVYLEAVKQGRIVLNNAETPVTTLGNSPKAIVTMFYANDPFLQHIQKSTADRHSRPWQLFLCLYISQSTAHYLCSQCTRRHKQDIF